jgi:complex iron-sulfur molybdoenzyme family reductase subunit gamma
MLETQAVHSEGVLYIRMSWDDDTRDARVIGVDQFADAAAVEFPARAASSVPALCMGQADGGVNIWHWRAGNQEGLPESIEDLSASGYVDRYPSTDELYFPARAAGNPVSLPHPVQDLVAVGFGTLTPAVDQAVRGIAVWDRGRWSVVFARELSHQAAEHVDLGEGASSDIAFAVWDGSEGERDGIKSVSQLMILDVAAEGFPRRDAIWLVIMFGSLLGVGAFALLLGTALERVVNRSSDRVAEPSPALGST